MVYGRYKIDFGKFLIFIAHELIGNATAPCAILHVCRAMSHGIGGE